jgi:hypothetical protein
LILAVAAVVTVIVLGISRRAARSGQTETPAIDAVDDEGG